MSSHCELRPKSVDARNHRYLPPASQAGDTASARLSVTCLVSPVSTLVTKIAWYNDFRRLEYAIHFESGLHTGSSVRCGTIHGSLPAIFALPLATSSTQMRTFVSVNRIFVESGDHAGV